MCSEYIIEQIPIPYAGWFLHIMIYTHIYIYIYIYIQLYILHVFELLTAPPCIFEMHICPFCPNTYCNTLQHTATHCNTQLPTPPHNKNRDAIPTLICSIQNTSHKETCLSDMFQRAEESTEHVLCITCSICKQYQQKRKLDAKMFYTRCFS